MDENRLYIAIDLKSFYASVECMERNLDPLTTYLVVADEGRTEKTICLAVSPALRAYGIPGRPRLFEVSERVRALNACREKGAGPSGWEGSTCDDIVLKGNPGLKLDYIVAVPRMSYYIEYSTRIYEIYLKYVSSEDIHVYSIDEVFMDVTNYGEIYRMSPEKLAKSIVDEVRQATGVTAVAGIGTNMYLAKIAMDIMAKRTQPDEDGVRIAFLDEMLYRKNLWPHKPLTDFWRVGKGYGKKLEKNGLYTMGDIARCSLGKKEDFHNEDLLYSLFGVNAELLIDHAWGWEPCTISQIKQYRPAAHSISSGQILMEPYSFENAKIVLKEMADMLALDMVAKEVVTSRIVLTIGYDRASLFEENADKIYMGEVTVDSYGRRVPRKAHGTCHLGGETNSGKKIIKSAESLYDKIVEKDLLIRRMTLTAEHVVPKCRRGEGKIQQLSFFDNEISESVREEEEKEKIMQETVLKIRKKYGNNSLIKGMSLQEKATARERNSQIGGHKA